MLCCHRMRRQAPDGPSAGIVVLTSSLGEECDLAALGAAMNLHARKCSAQFHRYLASVSQSRSNSLYVVRSLAQLGTITCMRLALLARNSFRTASAALAVKQKHPEHEQPGSYVQT